MTDQLHFKKIYVIFEVLRLVSVVFGTASVVKTICNEYVKFAIASCAVMYMSAVEILYKALGFTYKTTAKYQSEVFAESIYNFF